MLASCLRFGIESDCDIFLRNVCRFSKNHMALYNTIHNFS
jgi:hypothetical protein